MAERTSYRSGLIAESIAAIFLVCKGYRILARRYKTPVGEVDLVARRGKTIVFVEVKARANPTAALESITPRMKNRIARAALHFIASNPRYAPFGMRFDVIALTPPFRLRHLDNAWQQAA
jgi:putative endonuclease